MAKTLKKEFVESMTVLGFNPEQIKGSWKHVKESKNKVEHRELLDAAIRYLAMGGK